MDTLEVTPRRNNLNLNTDVEISIRESMLKVENMGSNPLLTEAIVKLNEARELVADFIDDRL